MYFNFFTSSQLPFLANQFILFCWSVLSLFSIHLYTVQTPLQTVFSTSVHSTVFIAGLKTVAVKVSHGEKAPCVFKVLCACTLQLLLQRAAHCCPDITCTCRENGRSSKHHTKSKLKCHEPSRKEHFVHPSAALKFATQCIFSLAHAPRDKVGEQRMWDRTPQLAQSIISVRLPFSSAALALRNLAVDCAQ